MKASLIRLIPFTLILCLSSIALASDDLIHSWVESQVASQDSGRGAGGWNPGFLGLKETEVRISDAGSYGGNANQTVRINFKPLFGMNTEYKLSSQRKKLMDHSLELSRQQRRALAYIQILELWKNLKFREILRKSEKIFSRASVALRSNQAQHLPGIRSSETIVKIAQFHEVKNKVEALCEHQIAFLNLNKEKSKQLVEQLSSINLLGVQDIAKNINTLKGNSLNLQVNRAKQMEAILELSQKKNEAFQVFNFLSIEKEEATRNRPEEYIARVSLRIPFLSDSEELRQAKSKYLLSKSKLKMEESQIQREGIELRAQIQGLLEKSKILEMLPSESDALKAMAHNMSSIFDGADREGKFLEGQSERLNTKVSLIENYLLLLMKNGKLSAKNKNYLRHI